MWLQWQLILINQSINQSIKLFKKYSPLIDRGRKLREWKKSEKIALTGIRTPDLETHGIWSGIGTATAYCLTQCSNGRLLGTFLFSRQDNHVQKCRTSLIREKSSTIPWDPNCAGTLKMRVLEWARRVRRVYWTMRTISASQRSTRWQLGSRFCKITICAAVFYEKFPLLSKFKRPRIICQKFQTEK